MSNQRHVLMRGDILCFCRWKREYEQRDICIFGSAWDVELCSVAEAVPNAVVSSLHRPIVPAPPPSLFHPTVALPPSPLPHLLCLHMGAFTTTTTIASSPREQTHQQYLFKRERQRRRLPQQFTTSRLEEVRAPRAHSVGRHEPLAFSCNQAKVSFWHAVSTVLKLLFFFSFL